MLRFANIMWKNDPNLDNINLVWENMPLQSELLMKILCKLGFQVTRDCVMAVVRTCSAAISSAFAVYDVNSLIKAVTEDHPSVKAISELISKIRRELENIVNLRNCVRDMQTII